jgi:hypothetical protein
VSDEVGLVCWSCGVATRPGQRFCNTCGVALVGVADAADGVSTDDLPTDEVPVTHAERGSAPLPDDLDQFFESPDFQVVEQMTPSAERIGRLAAEDPTPPHGTPVTDQFGDDDEPFIYLDPVGLTVRLRLVIVLLAAATAVSVAAASIFTFVSMDYTGEGSAHFVFAAGDFTSNAMVAALIAVALLLGGAIAAARGSRGGVGLIGGVGAAAAGLMLWLVGQAIMFVDTARHVAAARGGTFRLHLVLDVGFVAAVVAAVLGGACLVVSILAPRNPAEVRAHPAIGALGALGALILAVGAFLPAKSGRLADNFSSAHAIAGGVLRKAFLVFMFAVGYAPVPPITTWFRVLFMVLLLGGVVGFLRASAWGLGFALGSVSVALWLTITSLFAIGKYPYGIGGGNVGSTGHPPHVAVTVGFVVLLVAAAAQATWMWRQVRRESAAT